MAKKQKRNFSKTPVIILDFDSNEDLFEGVFEKAYELDCRVLDLKITLGTIPPNLNIIGLITVGLPDDPTVKYIMEKKLPVVRAGKFPFPEEDKIIPAVLPDTFTAGQLAADHFADRQFKSVGFVSNYPLAAKPIFYNSFRDRALERGCECNLLQVKTSRSDKPSKRFESRKAQILNWLQKLPKPTGIFTYNDLNAARIYTIASNSGYEIPEEFAILGCSNIKNICDFLPVPLSSIDLNREEQGRFAVELLYKLKHGEKKPTEPIIIPPKGIFTRQSTNLLAVQDPVVARALRFIWHNFTEPISIADIATETGVARCTIIKKFKKCIGHSINYEIRKRRIKKACELLANSRLTISDIADLSGFHTANYFHITFRKFYGITPNEFRKKNFERDIS